MVDEKQDGNWYCPNCGYLSPSRVTFSQTCDTCHQPVEWHTVSDQTRIQELEAELAKYKLKYTKDKPTEPGWYWWGVFRSICNTSYFDEKIIRIVEDSKGFLKEEYYCSLDEMPGYFAGPIPEPEKEV